MNLREYVYVCVYWNNKISILFSIINYFFNNMKIKFQLII